MFLYKHLVFFQWTFFCWDTFWFSFCWDTIECRARLLQRCARCHRMCHAWRLLDVAAPPPYVFRASHVCALIRSNATFSPWHSFESEKFSGYGDTKLVLGQKESKCSTEPLRNPRIIVSLAGFVSVISGRRLVEAAWNIYDSVICSNLIYCL